MLQNIKARIRSGKDSRHISFAGNQAGNQTVKVKQDRINTTVQNREKKHNMLIESHVSMPGQYKHAPNTMQAKKKKRVV